MDFERLNGSKRNRSLRQTLSMKIKMLSVQMKKVLEGEKNVNAN